jgi:tRNA A-37 threonylcarbamoyl transferase component Bud32
MMATLEDVQDEVLERLHAGDSVDRHGVLAENPEHATALGAFFDLLALIEAEPDGDAAAPARLGEFRILGEIGRGGMGVVYEAEQASLKRRVALKVLPPALRVDARLLQRFRREAEAAGRLRHPGIVPVYSVGEAAGTPFFAMEMVEGRSLDRVIRDLREGDADGVPADPGERRAWAVETIARVADALGYAHAEGILHRDVKPGNILLEPDGTPRLTDFGLALDLHAPGLTRAGEVFGSPQYMSPEQAVRQEAPLDARTDVYSLAVTLYELLTLRLPYEATTGPQLLTALAGGHLVAPRKADPTLPPDLEAVLLRALRKDPDDRYASAADFADDLRAAIEGREVTAPRPCVAKPRWRRRSTWLGLAAAIVLGFGVRACLSMRPPGEEAVEELGVAHAFDYDEIRRLAVGELEDGERLLRSSCAFVEEMRSVVSRAEMGQYKVTSRFALVHDGELDERIVILVSFDAQVDRGQWRDVDGSFISLGPSVSVGKGAVSKFSLSASPPWAKLLGKGAPNPSYTVRHRAKVQVAHKPEGWEGVKDGPLEGGTTITWTGDERTVLVYPEFPPDYPRVVGDAELDVRMRKALEPDAVQFLMVSGARQVQLMIRYEDSRVPENAACVIEVRRPSDGRLIGTGKHTYHAESARAGTRQVDSHRAMYSLPVDLPEKPADGEAGLLLDLESGKLKKLRLVFKPSRKVALDEPTFDRYWGGTVDVVVPVEDWSVGDVK